MSGPLLECTALAVARGGLPVLSGVTLRVGAGEALVLRGPNGAGKTTLLRTFAGLQPASDGSFEAAPAAYFGHQDGMKATLSVRENLAFWAAMYGTAGVDAAMETFDLVSLEARPAGQLSAGQRRRLGLARLAVTGRDLWLLDEPTASLDAAAKEMFRGVVTRHLAGGGAAVIATHEELGLDAPVLDVSAFRATESGQGAFDEAFL